MQFPDAARTCLEGDFLAVYVYNKVKTIIKRLNNAKRWTNYLVCNIEVEPTPWSYYTTRQTCPHESRNYNMVYTFGSAASVGSDICNSRNYNMVYTVRRNCTYLLSICDSRNFTMVYTVRRNCTYLLSICDSRNFTMVYTQRYKKNGRAWSAIAEILLWFTPYGIVSSNASLSAIAEILLWFTPLTLCQFPYMNLQ